ncbi:MAG TPA: DUF4411 family protein [Thermoanaerobaculia bacterium]|nr:DUF4411 family protein [Thermoanaerobaculia bacterium]
MPYLLDANVFIQAKNLHYGLDFCPAFWDWLIDRHNAGVVYSVEKVSGELIAGADELAQWAASLPAAFFLTPDPSVAPSLTTVSRWATSGQYEPAAISTFLQVADYYLVAQAHAGGYTVVTHERPSATTRRIKIPDACIGVGVAFMTPFEMLRRERARFILGTP